MPDLLGFNSNRELGFDPNRSLGFDPNRKLTFDPRRSLTFLPNRDLGFGKRGPVFRGFVCPVCAVSVTETQPTCTECGAVFEPKAKIAAPPASPVLPAPPVAPPRPPPSIRAFPPPPKRAEVQHCAYCGARVASTDAFCWNCGSSARGGR
ncbi:MAG: zinc ribbon domain-containing protein [Euryarchaeota archaeon]|nr:zinc ribbon domain-containing protein [Euryarchaeota archaeon]